MLDKLAESKAQPWTNQLEQAVQSVSLSQAGQYQREIAFMLQNFRTARDAQSTSDPAIATKMDTSAKTIQSSASSQKKQTEFNAKIVDKIALHLNKPGHPVAKILDNFSSAFTRVYADFVDNEQTDNKQLIQRIQNKGKQFTLSVFQGVNEFVNAVFETILALYDPDIDGFLEDVEHDLDRLVLGKTV